MRLTALASINHNELETVVNMQISNISVEEEPHPPTVTGSALNIETLPGEWISNNSIEEINPVGLHQSITIREREQAEGEEDAEDEGGEGEAEAEGEGGGEEEENATNLTPYALTAVLSVLAGASVGGLKQGKHTPLIPIANPFALLSVVFVGIAYATYCIIYWIKDRSGYKKLTAVYYITCYLTFILALSMLFTTT